MRSEFHQKCVHSGSYKRLSLLGQGNPFANKMQVSENCSICRTSMSRKPVVRLIPCLHLLHSACVAPLLNQDHSLCPLCRDDIEETEEYERRKYKASSARDRELIVESSNRGEDWGALAKTLGVKYKTAYAWIRTGEIAGANRGGCKPKLLNEEQVEQVLRWIEDDTTLSLVQLKAKIFEAFQVILSTTTVGNYVTNRLYTVKKIHWEPLTMNSDDNKNLRKLYVESLTTHIQEGRQVLWMDETNFNLFCRRNCGRSRQGTRAVSKRPTSRGKISFRKQLKPMQNFISAVLLVMICHYM